MLKFLLGLLPDFLKVYLGIKVDTAESLGKAEQEAFDAENIAKTLAAEAQAAAQAPVSNEAMVSLLKAGKLAVALLLLSSCASNHGTAYGCLPVREWSVVDQQNAAADLETLPANSPVLLMMRDYAALRSMSRACNGG